MSLDRIHPKCVNLLESIDDAKEISRMPLGQHRQHISQSWRQEISELLLREELKEGRAIWV